MRKSGFIISVLLLFSTLCLAQQNETKPDSVQPAIDAATQWLALTTDGKYAESWEDAVQKLRVEVDKEFKHKKEDKAIYTEK